MIRRMKAYRCLVRQYGPSGCALRVYHDFLRRTGRLKRRFPTWAWADRPLAYWLAEGVPPDGAGYRGFRASGPVRFFFPLGRPPQVPACLAGDAVEQAHRLLDGQFLYFSHAWGKLGFPDPQWLTNPFTGQSADGGVHWCDARDFLDRQGDIKYLWEPSRFAWVYALARAYAATGQEQYPQAFWQLLESWLAANPPNHAPNWQCGQEVAIRMMACCFALHAFWASPASTDERIARLVVILAASAERIDGNIEAAIGQRSNHGASEAAGLYTAGLLLPELAGAAGWRRRGKALLEAEARRHNWPDGSYVQHSMNYQRMTMQIYLWCMRLGQLNGEDFSPLTRQRLQRSCQFLYQLQDDAAGRMPNYGSNDGALVLPLNGCGYQDFRPAIGAMHFLTAGKRLYPPGPWDEDLLWLFGRGALEAPVEALPRSSAEFDCGGYYSLRGRESWAMTRCHSFRNRPGQADMLHLDLWWRGLNLLRDSGTFRYYDPPERRNEYFLSTAAHNTVTLAGQSQMVKGPRFQWFSLARSRFLGHWRQGDLDVLAGEHYGYRRLPSRAVHRRTICRMGEDCWLIVDDVLGRGAERADLHWHLPDCPAELTASAVRLATAAGPVGLEVACSAPGMECILRRGADEPDRMGWQSLYYGLREPAWTLRASVTAALPLRFISMVCLGGTSRFEQRATQGQLAWTLGAGPRTCRAELADLGRAGPAVRWIELGGQRLPIA